MLDRLTTFLLTLVLDMCNTPYMVDNIDISSVAAKLSGEFDALIDERQEIRVKSAKLNARAEEIDRKLSGIQQTLQGLSLYSTAQDPPTELTKKTTTTIAEMIGHMRNAMDMTFAVAGPDVPKSLSECVRDILRQKGDWMSAVQVREALLAAAFDFSNYTSNPLSSIHTTLKRLAQEELETETRTDGQVYRWKEESQPAPQSDAKELLKKLDAIKMRDAVAEAKRIEAIGEAQNKTKRHIRKI